ncbi:MAG: hypothetical protein PHW76_04680 [Alphaproteobacteria bacterium]|nr:hypothetical protein [Alphaproteobacteria bacterium]
MEAAISTDRPRDTDNTVEKVRELRDEQSSLVETDSPVSLYNEVLAVQIDAKFSQAERLEEKLETLMERQEARLMQIEAHQPGFLSLPKTRSNWNQQILQQQAYMQTLIGRMEVVREIREEMTPHGPRIEELAARKIRFHKPEMAAEFDAMMTATRRHLEQERARVQKKEQEKKRGVSLVVSKSVERS